MRIMVDSIGLSESCRKRSSTEILDQIPTSHAVTIDFNSIVTIQGYCFG